MDCIVSWPLGGLRCGDLGIWDSGPGEGVGEFRRGGVDGLREGGGDG